MQRGILWAAVIVSLSVAAWGQTTQPQTEPAVPSIRPGSTEEAAAVAGRAPDAADEYDEPTDVPASALPKPPLPIWPELTWPTLAWFGMLAVLMVLLCGKPVLSLCNVDALVLALTCLLFPLRAAAGTSGERVHGWVYLLLMIAAVYWLARGIWCVLARRVPQCGGNLTVAAALVLLIAGIALAFTQIARTPMSPAARDGLLGGIHLASTGKLPYGEVRGADARSPLLYLLGAAVTSTGEPWVCVDGRELEADWGAVRDWIGEGRDVELFAIAQLNGLLFVGTLLGVLLIARRLHSMPLALAAGALFCIFPGALEAAAQPDVMLAALLLTWSVVLLFVPFAGGLLAMLCLMLAGLAWPWAWLLVPVWLGYCLRRGVHAVGAVVGVLLALAGILAGVTWLTAPTLPRTEGALAAAGIQPAYTADYRNDVLLVEYAKEGEVTDRDFKAPLWRALVERDDVKLADILDDGVGGDASLPAGVDAASIPLYGIEVSPTARRTLEIDYRAALKGQPVLARLRAGLRTVLEATWLPAEPAESAVKGTWAVWAGQSDPGHWVILRRVVKVLSGLLALLLGAFLLVTARQETRHLIGSAVAVASGALLASELGAAAHWAWLLPLILALLLASGGTVADGATSAAVRSRLEPPNPALVARAPAPVTPPPSLAPGATGPAPRITVER